MGGWRVVAVLRSWYKVQMKTLFRWVFRLFVLSIVLVVALVLLKDTLVKAIAERQIRAQTGMDVKIGKFELGLLSPTLSIEDFKIYNTAEFGGSPFLVMPELHVECEGSDLMAHRLHLKLVRFNLAEINIVQNLLRIDPFHKS